MADTGKKPNEVILWIQGKTAEPLDVIVSRATTRELLIVHGSAFTALFLDEIRDKSKEAFVAVATELARRIDEGRAK